MLTDFRLRVFVVVARELSFTKAAAELCVSQPAVTKHIKELERLCSQTLFLRQGSRIALTSRGAALVPYAQSILEGYDKLNDSLQGEEHGYSGVIRVGASTTIIQYILPAILAKFKNQYPNVEIHLRGGNSEDITSEVISQRLDFALVEGSATSSACHYENLAQDRLILVAARNNVTQIKVKDISSLPLVIRESGSGTLDVLERHLASKNISLRDLNIVMQIGSSEGIIRYLRESESYAFISESAVREHIEAGRLHEVTIEGLEIARSLRVLSLHGHQGRLMELFIEFCRSKMA